MAHSHENTDGFSAPALLVHQRVLFVIDHTLAQIPQIKGVRKSSDGKLQRYGNISTSTCIYFHSIWTYISKTSQWI